ncbi:PGC-1 and ERR-induced regulator in muscle protein 1 [Melozone crissalis]|uniref:PGC-1 and ERR-induced regulator in muscle protein 1 n=1 Tax=Melozone crissalis TaxID=40204 RepID=UPI0023DA28B0|nr:PGC-1 and ERR-induced regulator in muscle protein 1 [Melozone crissalis]
MDNFEYSIQLTDREWAEFLRAAEECSLAPASLATAEEQSLSDIEQGDSGGRGSAAGPGSEPAAPGSANPVPRGARAGASAGASRGQCCVPGSERGAEPGRVLCDSDSHRPGCAAAMPSAQRRQQPPRAPGGTAQGTAGAAPAGMEQGGDAGGTQAPLAQPGAPAAPGAPSEPPQQQQQPGTAGTEPRVAAQQQQQQQPGTAGTEPPVAAQQDTAGTGPGSPGGSPSVVRPKVPAQPRKSRKQRGAEGDRDAPSAAPPGKAPPGSPASPRKGRARDRAARAALARPGSEEAAESRRAEGGEGGPKAPGRTKGTRPPRAAQGGRDTVPAVPADGAAALPGEESQEMPGKPLQPRNVTALGGNAAEGAGGQPADETPRAASPLCFAEGASGKPNSLDVTWPEMYEYLFCDSQEEEELGSSLEGRRSPLQREISWPELYEYFFTEPEGSRKKGRAKDRKRKKLRGLERPGLHQEAPSPAADKDTVVISVPDVHERFFPEPAPNRMGWRGIFSLAPASEVKKAVRALGSLLQRRAQLGGGQAPGSQALVPRRSGEELALVPLGGAQGWPEVEDSALALRGKSCCPLQGPEEPRVLSHKDMCLVFCAFASWAVKTSDLQAPDAWKTMFLASFGTLSAIRYFRRTVREGHPRT